MPETVVVDASVAVKWFLPEPGAERAWLLLRAGHRLIGHGEAALQSLGGERDRVGGRAGARGFASEA